MEPRVDAVVVSFNSRATLRDCVGPLAAVPGVSVTVVDNGSSDGSLASIADLPVEAIVAERNGGFGFGCNLGMAGGDANYVLFLNPDARLAAADLDKMLAVFAAEPDVALVGPRTLDDDGGLILSQRRFQRVGSTWAQALFLHRVLPRAGWANEIVTTPSAYERPSYPEWLSGACMLARRDVLEAVGGFDEGFFLYGEDMDLCARIRASGRHVRFEPRAVASHACGHSAPRASLYGVLAESRLRFARLHSGCVGAGLQHAGLVVGALTHVLTSIGRPAARRGHLAALRALVGGDVTARAAEAATGPPREAVATDAG